MATAENILSQSSPTRVVKSGSGTASRPATPYETQRSVNDKYRGSELSNDFDQLNKDQDRTEQQLQSTYGFAFSNWAADDVERFAEHRDLVTEQIRNGYYDEESGNGGYVKFLQHLEGLNNAHDSFTPSEAMITQRQNLQQAILEGQAHYDNNFELVDDFDTFTQKNSVFNTGGVSNVEFDPLTMQHVGTYLDMEGNPIIGEDGQETRGPVSGAPTRNSRELFFPTLKERGGMDPSDIANKFSEGVYQKVYGGPGGSGGDIDEALGLISVQLIEQLSDVESLPPDSPYRNALVTANNEFEGQESQPGYNAITVYVKKVVDKIKEMVENKSGHSDEMYWNTTTGDLNPSGNSEPTE